MNHETTKGDSASRPPNSAAPESDPPRSGSSRSGAGDPTVPDNPPARDPRAELGFRQMAENARQVFWIFSPDFSETLYVNPAFEDLFGLSLETVYARAASFVEVVHRDDLEGLQWAMREVRHRPMEGVDFRVVHSDGTIRWALARGFPMRDEHGEVDRVVGTTEDITDRKEAEAGLREAEAHYRWLVQNAPYAVYALDAEGCFTELNPAGEMFIGRPLSEVLGQHFSTVIAPVDIEKATRAFEQVMAGEADGLVFEERIRLPTGEERLIEVTESAIHEDGRIVGTHGMARDITGDAERERALRRTERVATLGTLVGGVAHELNNPLHAIMSFASMLLETPRPAEEREDLETIHREAIRAASIVSDLRDLARRSQERAEIRTAVDINDVVSHVLRTRRYPLETRGIVVEEMLSADLPPVSGDRSEIEQVVVNLVLNAEYAMQGRDERRLTVRTEASENDVFLEIGDTGTGIAASHRERIFDPFFTTKPPGEGTGLGLALAHGIVDDHGGSVHLESEPGEGTTFRIVLPAAEETLPELERPQPGPTVARRHLRVLVVDDERAIRTALSRYLSRRRGHRVDEVSDGRAALRIIEADTHRYDVIVSDLRMPGLGGDELLARLAALGQGLERRMIVLTGDAASGDAARVLAEADVPVVYKPVAMAALADIIEEHAAAIG